MTRLEVLYRQREDCLKTIHEIMRSGQSVEVEGMKRTMPSLEKVQSLLNNIDNEITKLERINLNERRTRMRVVIPA